MKIPVETVAQRYRPAQSARRRGAPGAIDPHLAADPAVRSSAWSLSSPETAPLQRVVELSQRLVHAQERERHRLSAQLHQRTSPNLAAIRLNLKSLTAALPGPVSEDIEALLADTAGLLDDTLAGIRDICADLRPAVLDYAGLVAALDSYAQQFAARTGLAVRFDYRSFQLRLPCELESLLFRIGQEALTNCARHARAGSVANLLRSEGERVVMVIADDGVGFAPDATPARGCPRGLGLRTMRERAEFAGGSFRLDSAPGRGTRIRVEIDGELN